MPSRVLREGIITSEPVNALEWPEEVFYRRLHSVVDDFGRYSANPQLLRAAMYPLKLDAVKAADVEKWLAACERVGLVRRYEAEGKHCLQVEKFEQRLRMAKSKYPAPPDTRPAGAGQMTDKRPPSASKPPPESEAEADIGVGHRRKGLQGGLTLEGANGKPVESIPLNDGTEFHVTRKMFEELDRLYPAVDPQQTLREIRGWNLANKARRKTKRGIERHIFDWFAREQDKQSRRPA